MIFKNLVFSTLLTLSWSVWALESTPQKIDFVAGESGKPISLVFDGLILDKSKSIEITKNHKDPLIVFLNKIVEKNKLGNKKGIVSLWNFDERKKIMEMMSKPRVFEHNTSLFKNIKSSNLLGYIEYNNHVICFLEHELQGVGAYRKIYPLKYDKGNYYQTNSLAKDFLFSKVFYDLGMHIWPK